VAASSWTATGLTDLPGLYAAGEVTQSGCWRNRLASNSLLECFVYGEACANHIAAHWDELPPRPASAPWDESRVTDWTKRWSSSRTGPKSPLHVELCRHHPHHQAAGARAARIRMLTDEINDYYGHFRVTPDDRAAQPAPDRRADRPLRAASQGEPGTSLYARLSETLPEAVDTILIP
jgi:L-aspartate oxidase